MKRWFKVISIYSRTFNNNIIFDIRELSFNKNLVKNDGLLINAISSIENISYEGAEQKISNWVRRTNKKLQKQRYIEIKNIGSISLENTKYVFVPNQNSVFLKSSYGFNSIAVSYTHLRAHETV